MTKVLRSCGLAVLACLAMIAAWGVVMTARSGEWEHALHNIPDLTMAFTSVFATTAVVVFIPTFLVLERLPRVAGNRRVHVLAGALLGMCAYVGVGVAFRESNQTVWEVIRYSATHPGIFLPSSVPFTIAGATFGLVWSKSGEAQAKPSAA